MATDHPAPARCIGEGGQAGWLATRKGPRPSRRSEDGWSGLLGKMRQEIKVENTNGLMRKDQWITREIA